MKIAYTSLMLGRRETYRYPKGKPLPLKILNAITSVPAIVIPWVLVIESRRWLWSVPLAVLLVALTFVSRKLFAHYEFMGRAVPIPQSWVVVRYKNGRPTPIVALGIAFVADVAMMLIFGLAPFTHETAKIGVISLVLLLIGMGGAYIFIERHYVRTGVAREVKVHYPPSAPKPQQ
jgi:hypothetical protein